MILLFRDSGGHPSWIVTMSVWACIVVILKFLVNGITIPILGPQPLMTVMDFVYAMGIAMSPMGVHKAITAAADASGKSADAKIVAAQTLAKAGVSADAKLADALIVAAAKRQEDSPA